ncbi:MAG: hypothetical protein KAS23_01545 [Anaerohalosphaera sp.]|nr:hypothetical protein [Anaerohalosphaera sp.]
MAKNDPDKTRIRKCPRCAELVQLDAHICKHCKSELPLLSKRGKKQIIKDAEGHVPGWLAIVLIVGAIIVAFYIATSGSNSSSTDMRTRQWPGQSKTEPNVAPKTSSKKEDNQSVYKIVDSNIMPGIKRSLDVRLDKKVSEATLKKIAYELKAKDTRRYERTFICYYLPDMQVGAGAWATTHFDPNLEVKILGLTVEQENTMRQLPDDASRKVVGVWLDESPYIGSRITIFQQDDKLFMENKYTDGSGGKKEMVEKSSRGKRTFQITEKNRAGEFYLIDKQGNLQLWDKEGIIWTAKKIN